jgi:hypothetical protein
LVIRECETEEQVRLAYTEFCNLYPTKRQVDWTIRSEYFLAHADEYRGDTVLPEITGIVGFYDCPQTLFAFYSRLRETSVTAYPRVCSYLREELFARFSAFVLSPRTTFAELQESNRRLEAPVERDLDADELTWSPIIFDLFQQRMDNRTCISCRGPHARYIVLPCEHFYVCEKCSKAIRSCPVCNVDKQGRRFWR